MIGRIRRWTVAMLCVIAGSTMTQGCTGAPLTSIPVRVHGTVTDKITQAPIAGICVAVVSQSPATPTGSDGIYTIRCQLWAHETEVVRAVDPDGPANGGDYATSEVTFLNDGDGDEQVDIQMSPKQ